MVSTPSSIVIVTVLQLKKETEMSGLRKPNLNRIPSTSSEEVAEEVTEVAETVVEEVTETPSRAPLRQPATLDNEAQAQVPAPVRDQMPEPSRGAPLAATLPADDSFDGLEEELGFGSFPMLKLDKTEFVVGTTTFDVIEECVLLKGTKKHLFKARKGEDDGIPLVYSYDGVFTTSGERLDSVFEEWKEHGEMDGSPIKSTYMEVLTHIISAGDGSMNGELVMANIAPQSLRTLSGYQARLGLKGLRLNQAVTRLQKGQKVTIKGSNKTFYPWDFKFVKPAPTDLL